MGGDGDGAVLSRRGLVRGLAAAGVILSGVRPIRPASAAGYAARSHQEGQRLAFALSTGHLPGVQPLLDEYAAQTGVDVVPAAFPHASLYEELNVGLTLGTCAYDVVSLDDPWLPLFASGGFLSNLEELAVRARTGLDTDDFVPAFVALGKVEPSPWLQAIPWIGNVQVFACRDDVLGGIGRARPRTWDDVVAVAAAVNQTRSGTELYGVGIRGQAGNPAATTFLPILRGHGADIFDAAWQPQLETEQAEAAMATLLALAELAPPGVENVGQEELGQNLATGRIAQAADVWPNQVLQAYDVERSAVVGKVTIGAQPAQPGVAPTNLTGNWLLGIPAGCSQAGTALAFIRWLTAPEQQKRLLLERGLPPTRLSVRRDPDAVERLPFLPGLLDATQNAAPRPRTPHYPAVEAILGRWVAEAIAGRVAGREALTEANAEIRALLVRVGVIAG